MKIKVMLGAHEDETDVVEAFAKAAKKYEHQHQERFEDELVQRLLEEIDGFMQEHVILGGYRDMLSVLTTSGAFAEKDTRRAAED